MTHADDVDAIPDDVDVTRVADDALERRAREGQALVSESRAVALAARAMAARFQGGGRLLVLGAGEADVQHVAVEFLHPVIVGKRALPALSLAGDVAGTEDMGDRLSRQIFLLARPGDIALGILGDPRDRHGLRAGLDEARRRGLLTVLLRGVEAGATGVTAGHELGGTSGDPLLARELGVTAYHPLWELVHVFLEQSTRVGPGPVA